MRSLGVPKALVFVIVAAVVLRLLLFAFLFSGNDPQFFVLGDSNGYMRLAHNIVSGNGFTQSTEPPYLPDSIRTPAYPSVLAASEWMFGSYLPVVFLQILLSALLIVLTYRICLLVTGRESFALPAAALMAFEPFSVFINTSLLTETVFATFFVSGAYMSLRFIARSDIANLLWASAFFGFAALTRPIGQFIPLVLITLVLMHVPPRTYARYVAAAVIPFLMLTGPWLARNYITFGVPALSSSGLQNAYSDLGGAIVAYRDGIPSHVAKQQLEEDFAKRHGTNAVAIQQDLSFSTQLFREAVQIMLSHPIVTAKVFASIGLTFFTNDAWTYYLQRWELIPRYDVTFSPTYTLMTEGPIAAFQKTVEQTGATLVIPLAGRLFWIVVSALFLAGIVRLTWLGGTSRTYGIFLLMLVLYLFALSASVGFGVNGRFRYPANALFFTAAALGASVFVNWGREHLWLRRWIMPAH